MTLTTNISHAMSPQCPRRTLTTRLTICLSSLVLLMAVIDGNLMAASDGQNSSATPEVANSDHTIDNEIAGTLEPNATVDGVRDSNETSGETPAPQLNTGLSGAEDTDVTSSGNSSDETQLSVTNATVSGVTETKVNCTPVNANQTLDNQTVSEVILVNSSKLNQYLESKPNISQSTGAECALVIFYYKWCPFSAKYAKHFNALARVYPQFHVLAIDAYGLNSVNMRYGLVGIPSVLFFHNGKVVGKVNDSEPTVDGFVTYISQLTGMSPVGSTNITESDLSGPLSSEPEPRFDYLLLLSWIFAIVCFSYLFAKSNLFKTTIEAVRNNWREAEAQHEHID